MLYAYSLIGNKICATPNARAFCPECGDAVIPRCGNINIWHWAHKSNNDCDAWGEYETNWHLSWKRKWPKECVEVSITKMGIRHRADILTPNGIVIELQHSSISAQEIHEREAFYRNMIWVFDARLPYQEERLLFWDKGKYQTFRWKHPRKTLCFVTSDLILDVGYTTSLFHLKKLYQEPPSGGWGYYISKNSFITQHGGIT